MVLSWLKRGFVRARQTMRDSMLGGRMVKLWREKVGMWWFLSFHEPIYTSMFEEGESRLLGRSLAYGEGAERYPYWFTELRRKDADELYERIKNSLPINEERITSANQRRFQEFVDFYEKFRQAEGKYDDWYGRRSGIAPGAREVPDEAEFELSSEAPVRLPHIPTIELEFEGLKYKTAIGRAGRLAVMEESEGDQPIWKAMFTRAGAKKFWKGIWNWRMMWRATTHVYPPSDHKRIWFKLGRNQRHPNEPYEAWRSRVKANIQKGLSDPTGLSFLYRCFAESQGKRLWRHDPENPDFKVSGRLLEEAFKLYTDGNVIRGHIPGSYDAESRYEFHNLPASSQLAVLKLLVEYGIGPMQYEQGYLDKARKKEIMKEYGLDEQANNAISPAEINDRIQKGEMNPHLREAAQRSLREGVDYLNIIKQAETLPERAMEFLKPKPTVVVNEDGTVDLAGAVVDVNGQKIAHIPRGTQPFYIARWNIPTIAPLALRMLDFLPGYDEFVEPFVDLGIQMDTNLFELETRERQVIKQRIMALFHDGIADDPWDLPLKLATALAYTPERAARFSLAIHEIAKRVQGAHWDHLRIRVRQFQQGLEENVKLDYFTPKKLDLAPMDVIATQEIRARFLEKAFGTRRVIHLIRAYNESAEKGDSKAAADHFDGLSKMVQEVYRNTVIGAPYQEIERPERRFQDIADFLLNHYDVMRMVVGQDNDAIEEAVMGTRKFYKIYERANAFEKKAA